jgi:hypothetical protein
VRPFLIGPAEDSFHGKATAQSEKASHDGRDPAKESETRRSANSSNCCPQKGACATNDSYQGAQHTGHRAAGATQPATNTQSRQGFGIAQS